MSKADDEHPDGGDRLDRRSALTKVGVGVAAAWTAPVILSHTAASAATVPPECQVCESGNLVVNGNAESGVLTPWTSAGTSPLAFGIETWTDLGAFGLTPPSGVGTNAFGFIGDPGTSEVDTTLFQQVPFGPGCEDAAVTLEGVLGTLCYEQDGSSTLVVAVSLRDIDGNYLGPGTLGSLSAVATPGQTSGNATLQSTTGFMPAGAVSAQITVFWAGYAGNAPEPVVLAAVDDLSITVNCIS